MASRPHICKGLGGGEYEDVYLRSGSPKMPTLCILLRGDRYSLEIRPRHEDKGSRDTTFARHIFCGSADSSPPVLTSRSPTSPDKILFIQLLYSYSHNSNILTQTAPTALTFLDEPPSLPVHEFALALNSRRLPQSLGIRDMHR